MKERKLIICKHFEMGLNLIFIHSHQTRVINKNSLISHNFFFHFWSCHLTVEIFSWAKKRIFHNSDVWLISFSIHGVFFCLFEYPSMVMFFTTNKKKWFESKTEFFSRFFFFWSCDPLLPLIMKNVYRAFRTNSWKTFFFVQRKMRSLWDHFSFIEKKFINTFPANMAHSPARKKNTHNFVLCHSSHINRQCPEYSMRITKRRVY